MKYLSISLFVWVFFACSPTGKVGLSKHDKLLHSNLKTHVAFLADDKLEGRRTGTRGEEMAMQYIADRFKDYGIEPKGTNGYVQEFTIIEGKVYDSASVKLIINDQPLKAKTDFIPLAFSGNGSASAEGSPPLRQKGEVWFFDVSETLEENKNNPHFDMLEIIRKRAESDGNRGAKALLVYNSSNKVDNIQFSRFDSMPGVKIPVVYINQKAFKQTFSDATATYDINVQVSLTPKQRQARNVVGFIDNKAANTVIIGAHYDHLGYGEDGNSLDGAGSIHNGADDNASGVAAMLELARMLKSSPAKNNNYLFIAFSGEEMGLKGSKYWLENPSAKITANYMINMDMVGRYDSSKRLTIGGYGTTPTWGKVFQPSLYQPLQVKFDSSGMAPSDNASFYKNNIPVLFFFTNAHNDYHKATDDADKINYEGQTHIVNLVYNVIQKTDSESKLVFQKTNDPQMGRASFSVSLGVIPDYAYTGAGLRIDGVSKGRVAERIGLQAGDVLLQLGEYKFVDVQSYMQVLGKFRKGDKTKLTINRAGKTMQFDVEF